MQGLENIVAQYVLPGVQRPGQYVGGEWNSVRKRHSDVDVTVCLAFPDTYAIGMSHTGLQILYAILNDRADVAAERAYAPWPDMEQALRREGLPLYSLETFTPLRDFDIIGFSLQYELGYTNLLTMLDLGGIPLRASDRSPDEPLIIAGGPCALSPEPVAEFIDLFLLGDGEERICDLIDAFKRIRGGTVSSRAEMLHRLACEVENVYVPSLYEVAYAADGCIESISPLRDGVPEQVRSAVVRDLDSAPYPVKPVVPLSETVHDRITLEIMRGCGRGCRFCHAGVVKRPVRTRSVETLLRLAEESYRNTGHREISLASLSTGDYPHLRELIKELAMRFDGRAVGISLPSLRVGKDIAELPSMISGVRKSGLTLAPEAGGERLRQVIKKDLSDDDLCCAVEEAYACGWRHVKLYFMIGLPTEREEDISAIAALINRVRNIRRPGGQRGSVNVSIASFVPKPHTPFEREPMASLDELDAKMRALRASVPRRGVTLKFHKLERSFVEAVFCRGDRRLSDVLLAAWRSGCRMDAWSEFFDYDRWCAAFAENCIEPEFYANRRRSSDELLPWSHLSCGISAEFLRREREEALA